MAEEECQNRVLSEETTEKEDETQNSPSQKQGTSPNRDFFASNY